MAVNYNDERLTAVKNEEKAALSENEKLYGGMINESDKYYQTQIDASKQWAEKQSELQQQQTDFAIDKIEQNKAQAKKDYTKEQSGAYVDWQKQSNQYGATAEQIAAQGLDTSGFSESSQVSMYNTYQMRVAAARESYQLAVQNYNNSITEARLQNNSVLAEIAYQALQQQLELSLQGFQYKNQLLLDQADKKTQIQTNYWGRYQDVLGQINTENALAEQQRQYNETLAFQKEQAAADKAYKDAQLQLQRDQFNWQKAQASGSGGGSSSIKKSSGSSSASGGSSKGAKLGAAIKKGIDKITGVPGTKKDTSSNTGKESATVDMKSVLALGYGPISASKLNDLVEKGIVKETVSNGKIKFTFTPYGLKQKQLYSRMG